MDVDRQRRAPWMASPTFLPTPARLRRKAGRSIPPRFGAVKCTIWDSGLPRRTLEEHALIGVRQLTGTSPARSSKAQLSLQLTRQRMAWCVPRRRARAQRMCSPAACTVPRAIRSVLSVRGSCALSRARFGSGAELTTHCAMYTATTRRGSSAVCSWRI